MLLRMSSAEEMPLEDSSVTLITAGRAIQYFDFPKFFAECKRVLVPGGIVAFYSSEHIKFVIDEQPETAQRLNDLFTKVTLINYNHKKYILEIIFINRIFIGREF